MPDQSPDQEPGGDGSAGRDRLLHSLLKPTRRQAVVAILLALVGFAGITQVRATEVDGTYAGRREQDLIDLLNGLAGARQRAEAQRAELERTREGLTSATNQRQAAIEQAEQEAEALNVLAGLVPVTGPGIRVTIDEVDGQVELGSLLDVVQELRTVGAEAIQINAEVRVVADTSFEDATGGFLVDGTLVSPPYVVDVIGEPNVLEGAMEFAGGPRLEIEDDGGTIEAEQVSSLDIEAVHRPEEPEYAEADLGQ